MQALTPEPQLQIILSFEYNLFFSKILRRFDCDFIFPLFKPEAPTVNISPLSSLGKKEFSFNLTVSNEINSNQDEVIVELDTKLPCASGGYVSPSFLGGFSGAGSKVL